MKRYTFFSLYLWIALVLLFSCASAKSQPDAENGTLFLWKLEHENAILYFFGSIHMGTDAIYPLDDRIDAAYNASEKLVVELNANAPANQTAIQQLTMQQGIFSGTETIADYVTPEFLEKLNSLEEKYKMPMQIAARLKPWVLEVTLSSLEMQRLGYDAMLGLDIHFIGKAEADKKPIIELETAEGQVNLLSAIPLEDQVLSLEFALVDIDNIESDLAELVSTWKKGNTKEFAVLTMRSFETQPAFMDIYRRLFTERNIQWITQFEKMILSGGKYFIVIGAGHLAGKDNIIDLLQEKGYKVTQL